ncbi:LVIVD repeat-containing protein [Terracidiphilus gabretensis]|uniref:LVIVD repeat-containing protein n=1 Tax=Terracidiphilus gabretensis TaxID=1577687 RepID=UPI000A6BF938|nr:hypothetical protein [Terracidiphilus gabretensis]
MNTIRKAALYSAALTVLAVSAHSLAAQAAAPAPAPATKAPAAAPENPFAPTPAPPLPAGMTGSDTSDPRYTLKPGLYDAGEAAMGIKHLALLKKPDAFQINASTPDDPRVQKTLTQLGMPPGMKMPPAMQMVIAQLAFANSDFAFQGNHLFQGNFYGINIYDISNPAKTSLLTSLICPGGQGDVSVYGKLLFMSVEMPNGRLDCSAEGFAPPPAPKPGTPPSRTPPADPARFRGVRIFDISDIKNPKQVAAVQTCRGSHTHTLVLDPNDKDNVYVYVSGTSFVRPAEELAGCSGDAPDKDPNTALFRIEVIKVPLAHPDQAKVVSSPRVFIDPRTGALNGLNNGGAEHGDAKAKSEDTNQCHDITVYSAIGLAAGACSGNGILLDIKDPVNPKRVDAVNDPNYSYWHSASFSNDGSKVVFTDEWGGGLGARCRPNDPSKWGADAIFNLKDNKLSLQSYYKLPAAQGDTENCVAHNGSLIPIPGRDIEVQAWYQGGISIMDFTDPAKPFEIAYFDRGPIDPKMLVLGGDWSAYWYNGNIYGSEISRGLDIFELTPTKFLSQNEIDAAKAVKVAELNVQNQQKIMWPNKLVVAKAYVDQLTRSKALPETDLTAISDSIQQAEKSKLNKKSAAKLKTLADRLDSSSASVSDPADSKRVAALSAILKAPTA